jgi:hypothetical protein
MVKDVALSVLDIVAERLPAAHIQVLAGLPPQVDS